MRTKSGEADPRYQALLTLLSAADTVWGASRRFFERWQLGPSQFNILNLLQGNPAGLSQTDLGRRLVMHRSNVTGLIDRLERRGLVERQSAAGDRRAYCVVLTSAGASLLREILPRYYEGAIRVWDHLPAKRATVLIADLRRAAQNAERIAENLPK
jgi:DNA-binding MarR family transcriptional regulator